MSMNKIKLISIAALSVLLTTIFAVGAAVSEGTFTPSVYKVTVTKIELKTQAGAYVTVLNTPTVVDIASAAGANTVVQTLADKTFPAGTYTAIRLTVSANMTVSGTVNIGGTNYITDGSVNSGGAPDLVAGAPGTEVETAFTAPGGDVLAEIALPGSPVTIAEGENYGTVKVEIDVLNACEAFSVVVPGPATVYYCVPDDPAVTITKL